MSNYLKQQRIYEIQQLYRQWIALLPQLEEAQRQWQQGCDIMQKLAHFYFDGEYQRYVEAVENGWQPDLRTQGEHSVMSEDTLWNAFHDQQRLAWRQLRSAVAVLDQDGEN